MTQESTSYTEDMEQDDTPYFASFAMTRDADNIVQDVLICLNTFKMNGYYFVEVKEDVECRSGMSYNSLTGTFEVVTTEAESTSTGETTTS